jgi:glycosyltransferase involved in cell wall biosynthesis
VQAALLEPKMTSGRCDTEIGDLTLSLIIPCYNEELGLPDLIARCEEVIQELPGIEIILVDNGSTDDTPAVLAQLLQRSPQLQSVRVPQNIGYGFGVLSGIRAARNDVVAWTHADLQTDPMDAVRGLRLFNEAAEPERLFVKGLRCGRPATDVAFTVGMSIFETALFQIAIWDINAVPTMFHRSFCKNWTFDGWTNPPFDFSLDLFAYVTAKRRQMSIKRLAVHFGVREHGQSSWSTNTWKSKKKFIRRTWDYSLQLRRQLLEVVGAE